MEVLSSSRDLQLLLSEIQAIPTWIVDGTGVLMIQGQSKGIPYFGTEIAKAVEEISSFRNQQPLHLMVNKIPPGIHVPKHRDWLLPAKQGEKPTLERWHLPIQTSNEAGWWDEMNGEMIFDVGHWFGPMPYWLLHRVWNDSTIERIHLIVDLDTPERLGEYITSRT